MRVSTNQAVLIDVLTYKHRLRGAHAGPRGKACFGGLDQASGGFDGRQAVLKGAQLAVFDFDPLGLAHVADL